MITITLIMIKLGPMQIDVAEGGGGRGHWVDHSGSCKKFVPINGY